MSTHYVWLTSYNLCIIFHLQVTPIVRLQDMGCCLGHPSAVGDPSVPALAHVPFIHIQRTWSYDNINCPGIMYVKDDKLMYKLDSCLPCCLCTKSYNLKDITSVEVIDNQHITLSAGQRPPLTVNFNLGIKIIVSPQGSSDTTILAIMPDARDFATKLSCFDLPHLSVKSE